MIKILKKEKYWVVKNDEFDVIMQLLQTHPSYKAAIESTTINNVFNMVNTAVSEYQESNQQPVAQHAPIKRTYESNRQPQKNYMKMPAEPYADEEEQIDQDELDEQPEADEEPEEEAIDEEPEEEEPQQRMPAPPAPPQRKLSLLGQKQKAEAQALAAKRFKRTPGISPTAIPTAAQKAKPVFKKKGKIPEEEGDAEQNDVVDDEDDLMAEFDDSNF